MIQPAGYAEYLPGRETGHSAGRSLGETLRIWLLSIIVAELALMGGGRLLPIGPITVRMLLYGIALTWTALQLLLGARLRWDIFLFTLAFALLLVFDCILGLLSGADLASIGTDVKPLTYFFMLPFFSLALRDDADIRRVMSVLRWAGLLLAIIYLAVCLAQVAGLISPAVLLLAIGQGGDDTVSQEFFGRTDPATTSIFLFTYKGFLFLCVGIVLWVRKRGYGFFFAAICLLALLLTLVRGYLLAIGAVAAIYFLFFQRRLWLKLAGIMLLGLAVVVTLQLLQAGRAASDIAVSDQARSRTVNQVIERQSLPVVLVGHGLGVGVPERPHGMEISYLQIYHQQGIVGLAFWASLFLVLTLQILRISQRRWDPDAIALYLIALVVFVETATNPTINNPIGMSVVMIALVGLQRIEERQLASAPPLDAAAHGQNL